MHSLIGTHTYVYLLEGEHEPRTIRADSAENEGNGIVHFAGVTDETGARIASLRHRNVEWCVPAQASRKTGRTTTWPPAPDIGKTGDPVTPEALAAVMEYFAFDEHNARFFIALGRHETEGDLEPLDEQGNTA